MTDKELVVGVLRAFKKPVGWYPIAQRLGMRGILLKEELPLVLGKLVVDGTVVPAEVGGRLKYSLSE